MPILYMQIIIWYNYLTNSLQHKEHKRTSNSNIDDGTGDIDVPVTFVSPTSPCGRANLPTHFGLRDGNRRISEGPGKHASKQEVGGRKIRKS